MRKLRIFIVELVLVGLLVGWLLYRYPETIETVIPWIALAILWHITWEFGYQADFFKKTAIAAKGRWGHMWWTWVIAFAVGGTISVGYWYLIKVGLEELANRHNRNSGGEVSSKSSIRIKYSSRQVLQVANVPGNYNMILNLDNVATLLLTAPFSRKEATLLWPTLPTVTIAEPRPEEKYEFPGGGTVQAPGIGHGFEMHGLRLAGKSKVITFDFEHPVRFIRVGERIFRVSLESVRDKASKVRIPGQGGHDSEIIPGSIPK
ncbi:MAG: hypothetical protein WB763_01490 [Terriglobia bacterium]|jgi:hypothetical protein